MNCNSCYLTKCIASLLTHTHIFHPQVHGGITSKDIIRTVKKAEQIAAKNRSNHPEMHTVLFMDEANTTEAIGLIKEIMCDGTMHGERLTEPSLKFVAACNPYKRHAILPSVQKFYVTIAFPSHYLENLLLYIQPHKHISMLHISYMISKFIFVLYHFSNFEYYVTVFIFKFLAHSSTTTVD